MHEDAYLIAALKGMRTDSNGKVNHTLPRRSSAVDARCVYRCRRTILLRKHLGYSSQLKTQIIALNWFLRQIAWTSLRRGEELNMIVL